jgi:hypothetical protein
MVLHCNQSSDLISSKAILASFLPLQSDFSPREVWNLRENVKPHMKVSKSNCLLLLRSSNWEKTSVIHLKVCWFIRWLFAFHFLRSAYPTVFLAVFWNVWVQFVVPFTTKIFLCWCFIHIAEYIGLLFFLSTQLDLSLLDPYLHATPFQFSVYMYGSQRAFPFPWGNCPTSIYFPVLQVIVSVG